MAAKKKAKAKAKPKKKVKAKKAKAAVGKTWSAAEITALKVGYKTRHPSGIRWNGQNPARAGGCRLPAFPG